MTDQVFPNIRRLNHLWARAMVSMAWTQWTFLSAGFRFAKRMMEPPWAIPADEGPRPPPAVEAAVPSPSGGVENLSRLAQERMAKGLAPPREIYQAPYRSQIDWSRFPEWARPSDPELFEGCSHEG
jgi:hypothetical protein